MFSKGIELMFFSGFGSVINEPFHMNASALLFFQMNVLFLAVLVWGLCYASSEQNIERLMDHGQRFLPKLHTSILPVLIHPQA